MLFGCGWVILYFVVFYFLILCVERVFVIGEGFNMLVSVRWFIWDIIEVRYIVDDIKWLMRRYVVSCLFFFCLGCYGCYLKVVLL